MRTPSRRQRTRANGSSRSLSATTVRSPTDTAETPDTISGRVHGFHPPNALTGEQRYLVCRQQVLSVDGLGKRNDDPLGASDVGHPPRTLVLADSPPHPVAGGRDPVDGGAQVMTLEGDASQADLVGQSGRRARHTA